MFSKKYIDQQLNYQNFQMGITLPKMKHFRLNEQTIQTICPVSKKLPKIQKIVKNATDNQQM